MEFIPPKHREIFIESSCDCSDKNNILSICLKLPKLSRPTFTIIISLSSLNIHLPSLMQKASKPDSSLLLNFTKELILTSIPIFRNWNQLLHSTLLSSMKLFMNLKQINYLLFKKLFLMGLLQQHYQNQGECKTKMLWQL